MSHVPRTDDQSIGVGVETITIIGHKIATIIIAFKMECQRGEILRVELIIDMVPDERSFTKQVNLSSHDFIVTDFKLRRNEPPKMLANEIQNRAARLDLLEHRTILIDDQSRLS